MTTKRKEPTTSTKAVALPNGQSVIIGQIYKDKDPRREGRLVRICGVVGNYAEIRALDGMGRASGSLRTINLKQLRPIGKRKGFELMGTELPPPPSVEPGTPAFPKHSDITKPAAAAAEPSDGSN